MLDDYSGFYFNKTGQYQNVVYYISPQPEQDLYLIKKYNQMLNTEKVLKSIETGFNGYDYEIYKCDLLTKATENPENDDETIAMAIFTDFSNKQAFDGMFIIDNDMPMYDRLEEYLFYKTRDLPHLVEGRDPKNKLLSEEVNEKPAQVQQQPVQQPVQQVQEQPKEEEIEEIIEEPAPKNFNEQLMTPQQRAIEDSQTLAFQIVQNNEEINKEDNQ